MARLASCPRPLPRPPALSCTLSYCNSSTSSIAYMPHQSRRLNVLRLCAYSAPVEELQSTPLVQQGQHLGDYQPALDPMMQMSRRHLLMTAAAACTVARSCGEAWAEDVPSASASTTVQYMNASQGYQMMVPDSWEKKDKAGADVLFEDPDRRSTSVGITVNPVRVKSIQEFGPLDVVAERLLEVERKKESTLSVGIVGSSQREPSSGALLYDIEYDLDSTRGRKRILNTVTIFDSKLYILNGQFKCEKEDKGGCTGASAQAAIEQLRAVAASFDVTSS